MVFSVTGILLFQFYWLKQNYDREEKAVKTRVDLVFRESVMKLQISKLKLDWTAGDSSGKPVRLVIGESNRQEAKMLPAPEMITSINVIRDKLADSLVSLRPPKGTMMVTLSGTHEQQDAAITEDDGLELPPPRRRERIMNFIYGVDSLQDSLRVRDIDSVIALSLKKQELTIPFTIVRDTQRLETEKPVFNVVTIGLKNPVRYSIRTGNLFPFLIRRLVQPLLFSVLLLAITIAAFVVLNKNLARQRRLAELKNEFISNITHELKTPIATVGVAIEAMKNFNAMDNPERTREYLDISQHELNRLSLLVDKVLKLSMFEKQGIELKPEQLNLFGLVTEVMESLRLQLEKNKVQVDVQYTGNMVVRGDKLHLQSVVFNLIDNAIKYGKTADQAIIQVSLQEAEESVILEVADNGPGIPEAYQDKIFDKFFRVPHGETHNAKGYGLGLNYVAQVVKQHQGTIAVSSAEGKGTRFTITLPKQAV